MEKGLRPVDLNEINANASNVYEAVIVVAKKARLINNDTKLEFSTLLNTMVPAADDDYEDKENPDQMKLSLEFEKRPKPHIIALQQFLDGDVEFRYKDENE